MQRGPQRPWNGWNAKRRSKVPSVSGTSAGSSRPLRCFTSWTSPRPVCTTREFTGDNDFQVPSPVDFLGNKNNSPRFAETFLTSLACQRNLNFFKRSCLQQNNFWTRFLLLKDMVQRWRVTNRCESLHRCLPHCVVVRHKKGFFWRLGDSVPCSYPHSHCNLHFRLLLVSVFVTATRKLHDFICLLFFLPYSKCFCCGSWSSETFVADIWPLDAD